VEWEKGTVPCPRVQSRRRKVQVVKPQQRSLVEWTRQKWRTNSGKPSLQTGERYLPDAAWKSLSPAEKAATNAAKRKGMRSGKQFVAQPKKVAAKTARYR
jgi:hypothetical protein